MENKLFKQDYETEQNIRARHKTASMKYDTVGVEAARIEHRAFMKQVSDRGDSYARLYQLYSEALERGNLYIDLHDTIWDKDVAGLIMCLRENGIEHFTFSATWIRSVETAWLFVENGCTLEGLLEINSSHKNFDNEKYEKAHGYLFAVH